MDELNKMKENEKAFNDSAINRSKEALRKMKYEVAEELGSLGLQLGGGGVLPSRACSRVTGDMMRKKLASNEVRIFEEALAAHNRFMADNHAEHGR